MILDKITERARERVRANKLKLPLAEIRARAESVRNDASFAPAEAFLFEKSLKRDGIAFICEVKRASPSKGIIAEDFPYLDIAHEYEEAGAAAVSVLTEPDFFMGDDRYLCEIAAAVKIPALRKDFTVDEYMIYEAKLLGASAVLLICAALDESVLREYIKIADSVGLSALVEVHTESEAETALKSDARIIGVNNRDLKTFGVDIATSARIRPMIPRDRIFVSESGIKTADDIAKLRGIADAVLIGETLMRAKDKRRELAILRGE